MGDIIHTLPAVASLKHSFPGSHLTWVVEPKWAPLLEGNPFVDRVVILRRDTLAGLERSWRELRTVRYNLAIDFQGLVKSALVASIARPERIYGFHHTQLRERAAAVFYSDKIASNSAHIVDRNLDLAVAAGAATTVRAFPLPAGRPEGDLPLGDFVLASPFAGWRSKQWPSEHYERLARRLGSELQMPLVMNLPPGSVYAGLHTAWRHHSGLAGLIDATRRAAAVVGVDSGPLHLAAALGKPGVAIFGPTDPARNGPCGDTIRVLRAHAAETTYKRGSTVAESMRRISPEDVFEALRAVLGRCRTGQEACPTPMA
jgi:heptosyltransferase-1